MKSFFLQKKDPYLFRRSHSAAAAPIVVPTLAFIHAMKARSNLKSVPHSARKNRRTFCVLRYPASISVYRVIASACHSNAAMPFSVPGCAPQYRSGTYSSCGSEARS